MYRIVDVQQIGPSVSRMAIEAPLIARKHRPGQFVILINDENGERIPLTVADKDPDKGHIVVIFQEVGKSTREMALRKAGEHLFDVVGPLGKATHIDKFGTVICVGGGIGTAPIYPITRAFKEAGNHIITILGARNKDLFIMEEEMAAVSDELFYTTDDGSRGRHGFVTDEIQSILDGGTRVDLLVAIGPAIMMKVVSNLTRKYDLETLVSLNSIMVDGTGMCGACRVTVGGTTKFVCVDGPEFDGHQVDFDELMKRQQMYRDQEKLALKRFEEHLHECGCGGHHDGQ